MSLSRRRFLAGMAGAGLAAAGCANDSIGQSIKGQPLDSDLYPLAEARRLTARLEWPQAVAEPKRKVRIVVAHTWTPDFWPRQMQFDKFFMERHPNIEVRTENTSGGNYQDKYTIQAASGSLPDIMYAQWSFAQRFIEAGLFIDLDDYVANQPGFDRNDFTGPALGFYEYDDKLHGLAYDCGPIMLAYNKGLFDKAKLPYPSSDWTFDDLIEAGTKLTTGGAGNKTFGFGSFPDLALQYTSPLFLQPFGARFINAEATDCTLAEEKGYDAARWLVEHFEPITPSLGDLQTLSGGAFLMGRAAMDPAGSWLGPILNGSSEIKYGFTDWPAGPADRSTCALGSCYGITKHCEERDAAWIYLNEYVSTAGLTFMFATTGSGSPARKSAWPAYLKSKLAPEGAGLFYEALNSYATNDGVIYQSNGEKIADAAAPVWDRVRQGSVDVADGVAQIRDRVDPILLENT